MSANTVLSVSSLDFDTIRENLISALQQNPKFKDWDFLGSNISVLLDLLSYNTFMNNFYTNMNLAESFLDTAQLRDSAVSKAKELNYTPKSMISAKATINIRLTATDNPTTITVPVGTTFNTRIDNSVLSFITNTPVILRASENYSSDIDIFEGTLLTETFSVDTSTNQRFIISNDNIDINSLFVSVDGVEYKRVSSLLDVKSTDKIYFCQATSKNRYELIFGDSIYGSALINGASISASYRITKGPLGNGATVFSASGNISGYPVTVSTVEKSAGGADRESISSIKYNAPRHYQTQERAVTKNDYENILIENFPEIRTLNIFGGEEIVPPRYGKVFISIDLYDTEIVPSSLKTSISSFISKRNMIQITPIVVDPERTYLIVRAEANYDQNKTTDQASDVEAAMFNSISTYADNFMDDFDVTFMPSKLSSSIDLSHPSIISTTIDYSVMKYLGGPLSTLDFQNPLQTNSLTSTSFYLGGTEVILSSEKSYPSIDIISTLDSSILASNVGSISSDGKVNIDISSLDVTGIDNCQVFASTIDKEIYMKNNVIFNIYRPLCVTTAKAKRL